MSAEKKSPQTGPTQAPIAIVGMSCLFPKAQSLGEYWSNLKRGVDAITEVPADHWSATDYFDPDPKRPDHVYAKRGGFLDPIDFDPAEFGIAPSNLEATDSAQLLSLAVAQGALIDAGYGPKREFDRSRISCILGVTGTLQLSIALGGRLGHPIWRKALLEGGIDPAKADEIVGAIGDAYVMWQENSFPGLLGNVVAGRIANRFNLGGTNCVVDAACASSVSALHLAALELEAGRADMVLTGGADAFNDVFMYMCFSKTPALSPTGDARPFAADADGTILGEGVGMVVLKRLEDAQRDGDTIHAVIRGIGSSSDGRGKAIYAPSAEGQERALLSAYRAAGVSPATIGMVEAHGTGTKVGDAVEVSALKKVYQAARPKGVWCALGSVKSQIGHTKAAAGVAGLIKAALALKHKVLPPTLKVKSPNPGIDQDDTPFYINTEKRPWLSRRGFPRRAAVSAFGFGGSNFHMVVEEAQPQKQEIDWDGRVQIVALSADSIDEIKSRLSGISIEGKSWKDACRVFGATRRDFKITQPCRLVFVVEQGKLEFAKLAASILKRLDDDRDKMHWAMTEGVFFNRSPKPGLLAFLVPGQGAQYVGMARDLTCLFPKMQEILLAADLAYGDMADLACQLSDFIFPHATFSEEAKKLNELALRATHIAQPAVGAVGMGMICVLAMFGVHPAMAAGHSFGELVALFAGGKIGADDMHRLAKLRGEMMNLAAGAEPGAMLAVQAPLDQVERAMIEAKLEVAIANKNSPNQFVLSGGGAEIERAAQVFRERKVSCTALPVAAAFHSPLVAEAAKPFRDALEAIEFKPGGIPVFANTTAAPYPEDAAAARDLLGAQLARPVEFAAQIEGMHAAGARTFVEVGPGARLTGLVKSILGSRDYCALAVDASSGRADGVVDLAMALAQLTALGHAVDLTQWAPEADLDSAAAGAGKPRMTVAISGAPYRNPAKNLKSQISNLKSDGEPGGKTAPNGGHAPPPAAPAPQKPLIVPPGVARPIAASLPPKEAPVMPTPIPPPNGPATFGGEPRPAAASAPSGYVPRFDSPPVLPSFAPPSPAYAPASPFTATTASASGNPLLLEAFRATQENLAALQRLQEQASQLHRQFLQGQESAMQAFADLMARQQNFYEQAMGWAPSATPAPAAALIRPAPPATVGRFLPVAAPPQRSFSSPPVATASAECATPPSIQIPAGPNGKHDVAQPPSAAISAASSNLAAILLEIVSEKTGYPGETLTLDMDLESDLGIDSIKRVEIMSGLQEREPSLPAVQPDQMGALRTLRQIIDFLGEDASTVASPAPSIASIQSISSIPSASSALAPALLEIVSEKTGYPAETLSLDMDLESDLGIDSIKRVEIMSALQERMPSLPAVQPEQMGALRTLGQIIVFLGEDAAAPAHSNGASHHETKGGSLAAGIGEALLRAVAEKTGYPTEALKLEMDLEADLGIDSIKRVEILSAMQERFPDAPTAAPEELGKFRTLAQIIEFLSGAGAASQASAPRSSSVKSALSIASIPSIPSIKPTHSASNGNGHHGNGNGSNGHSNGHHPAEPAALRRAVLKTAPLRPEPRERLALPAESEIWVAGEPDDLRAAIAAQLARAGHRAIGISLAEAAGASTDNLRGLVIVAPGRRLAPDEIWTEASETFLKDAFAAAKRCAKTLRGAGAALFATVTRLDGAFGLGGAAADFDPVLGGLAGLAKTAAREWPEVACKAIDAAPSAPPNVAEAIVEELLSRGPVEVGIAAEGRIELVEEESEVDEPAGSFALPPGSVIVVSGGARGVTAEAAIALADAAGATLVLLGRSPAPEPEPDWIAGIEGEADLKRAILAKGNGHPLTPKEVEREFRRWSANREILAALARIEAAGARAFYRSVDIRDEASVRGALAAVRGEIGPIAGIVHGAGVLADRLIEEKTSEQFSAVFDTKVSGLRALLAASAEDDLKFIALFSSVSARYGRRGQVDYSMANEALNKASRREAARRPGCRVLAVNWGPWDGGMVNAGLKKVFEGEGIGLIPLREGARWLASELASGRRDVEIVVSGIHSGAAPAAKPAVPLIVAFERDVDAERCPILRSHVIGGRAVLPVALMIEWLAHGALHENPGLAFCGFEGLRVMRGVKLAEGESLRLRIGAAKGRPRGEHSMAAAELASGPPDRPVIHARAEILLGDAARRPSDGPSIELAGAPWEGSIDALYQAHLFHGDALRGIERVEISAQGAAAKFLPAPKPSAWLADSPRGSWIADPLALDCALQLGLVWCGEHCGAPALPSEIASYRQFARAFPKAGAECRMKAARVSAGLARADFEFLDPSGALVARVEGAEFTIDPSLREAFRRNSLLAGAAS